MNDSSAEEYESSSQQENRKLIQFLKNLIKTNEKKFTGIKISIVVTLNSFIIYPRMFWIFNYYKI